MPSAELQKEWRATAASLKRGSRFLVVDPSTVASRAAELNPVPEFLDHNELELAMLELEALALATGVVRVPRRTSIAR